MSRVRKTPRTVASEGEERAYREREDSTADLDWRTAEHVRLPKIAAHKPDVPYQSLIKLWRSEKVE